MLSHEAATPGVPANSASHLDDGLKSLHSMFPEIEHETLSELLAHHNGNVERVVDTMVEACRHADQMARAIAASIEGCRHDASDTSTDAEIARTMQVAMDREAAEIISQSTDQEAGRARLEARTVQSVPSLRAVNACNSLISKMRRRMAVDGRSTSKTHGARLLDSVPLEINEENFRPLVASVGSPVYTPPLLPAPAASQLLIDATDEPAAAPPGLPPTKESATSDRYSARVHRARNANRSRVSRASGATPETNAGQTAT